LAHIGFVKFNFAEQFSKKQKIQLIKYSFQLHLEKSKQFTKRALVSKNQIAEQKRLSSKIFSGCVFLQLRANFFNLHEHYYKLYY
jgi:hypothetical protein